jgi:hypothetical protein
VVEECRQELLVLLWRLQGKLAALLDCGEEVVALALGQEPKQLGGCRDVSGRVNIPEIALWVAERVEVRDDYGGSGVYRLTPQQLSPRKRWHVNGLPVNR